VTGAGGLDKPLTVGYSGNVDAGTATASASFAGDANHDPSNDSATFDIGQADSTTDVICPTSVTYDSSAQAPCTATATGAGGLSEDLDVSYSDNTNAGSASASASYAGDPNHKASNAETTFTIDPAESTTTVTCPAHVTFDGAAQTPCSAVASGVGGINVSLTVGYEDNVHAGTATASASYGGDPNHLGSDDSTTFVIDQAGSTVEVDCPTNVTYNGSAQEPCTAAATGAGGLDKPLTVVYSGNTDAGTALASATFDGDDDHTGSDNAATFAIDRADPSISVSAYHVAYDGDPHTATGSATGVKGETLAGLVLSGTTHTDAGNYAGDKWTFTDVTGNYEDASGTVDDSIAKADADIVVTRYSVTYDGETHTAAGAATGVKGEALEGLDLSGTTHTNAGSYTGDPWTFTDVTGNYNDDSGTVDDAIAKAKATITVTPYSVTYDGDPHTAAGSAEGVESTPANLSSLLDLSSTTHTHAGEFTDSWTFAGNANYDGASGTVADSIAKADAHIVVTPYHVTYDGAAHTAAGSATGVKDEGLAGLDLSGTTHTNAHAYAGDTWTFTEETGNYNDSHRTF
jgi:hypothetical protein